MGREGGREERLELVGRMEVGMTALIGVGNVCWGKAGILKKLGKG